VLSGQLTAGVLVPTGDVTIRIDGPRLRRPVVLTVPLRADGRFAALWPQGKVRADLALAALRSILAHTPGLSPRARQLLLASLNQTAGVYTVTYRYAGDANFTAASAKIRTVVAYATQVLGGTPHIVQPGTPLTVELQVLDGRGANISAPALFVKLVRLAGPDGTMPAAGSVVYVGKPMQLYRVQLPTTDLTAAGAYTLSFKVGLDPTLHTLSFRVAPFRF